MELKIWKHLWIFQCKSHFYYDKWSLRSSRIMKRTKEANVFLRVSSNDFYFITRKKKLLSEFGVRITVDRSTIPRILRYFGYKYKSHEIDKHKSESWLMIKTY